MIDYNTEGKYEQADTNAEQRQPYPLAFGLSAQFCNMGAFHPAGNADKDEKKPADGGKPYMVADVHRQAYPFADINLGNLLHRCAQIVCVANLLQLSELRFIGLKDSMIMFRDFSC
jgi:hypothetical protein